MHGLTRCAFAQQIAALAAALKADEKHASNQKQGNTPRHY
jgi:hypothetical protein